MDVPQKNTIKDYAANSYYHVYTRGVNKQKIFQDVTDYRYFMTLFARYLSKKHDPVLSYPDYPDYSGQIKLLSFCLMPNHIHLLINQLENPDALPKFMSSILTSYSKYYNKKYRRVGSLYESRYKAKLIDNDSHLTHLSRYIHMNPRNWAAYRFSSLDYIYDSNAPDWLTTGFIRSEFTHQSQYLKFLEEYQDNKDILKEVEYQLANE